MQGHRIINGASNFSLAQDLRKSVTTLNPNRILVKHMLVSFRNERRRDAWNAEQEFCVRSGMRLSRSLPLWQVAQLYAQNGGLDFIEAAVPTWLAADVFGGLPVIAQRL